MVRKVLGAHSFPHSWAIPRCPKRKSFWRLLPLVALYTTSTLDDPRYQKGWFDLAFIAYHIVFWSMIRQFVTINICRPIAKYYGIRKEGKLDRFGEQGYAVFYFFIMGVGDWLVPICTVFGVIMLTLASASCPNCQPGGIGRNTSGLVRFFTYDLLPMLTMHLDYPHWTWCGTEALLSHADGVLVSAATGYAS